MKINTYTSKGVRKSAGMNLPKDFIEKENMKLLAQAIRVYEWRKHPGLSKTKRRGEVSRTKRKAYRQKGTGMARHGAKSAPIFVGGGKAHGPTGAKRVLELPRKMRKYALKVALGLKVKEGQLITVDGLISLKKTKEAVNLIEKIVTKEKLTNRNLKYTFALSEKNKEAELALRNIENVEVLPFRNLNAYSIYFGGVIVIDKDAFSEQKDLKTKKRKK